MPQLTLPLRADETTKVLLKGLSSRRMKDVLEKRFGLKGGKRKTLEAVGKEYKITRERVRQIEAEALRHVHKSEALQAVSPVLKAIADHVHLSGDVIAARHLYQQLSSPAAIPHVAFLLNVGKEFLELPESDEFCQRWTVNKSRAEEAEKGIKLSLHALKEKGIPISQNELHALVHENIRSIRGESVSENAVESYVASCKLIKKNPYGEYGLATWPTVSPRGVKDKAYLVLAKSGSPMHFREVAQAINKMNWTKKRAHPQTVHNELIKDPRFVLVGRGLYGLKSWGYEAGTVRDVLVSVLKKAGRPLRKSEVIEQVLEKRFVKPPTVVLNLQDKSLFKKVDGDRYTLV